MEDNTVWDGKEREIEEKRLLQKERVLCANVCVYVCVYKLTTTVEGDLKAFLSLATIPKCGRGRFSVPWIAPLYSLYVLFNAES